MSDKKTITPVLWFDNQAEEAVQLYTSIFPDSKTSSTMRNGGAVLAVGFSLSGQEFMAINGGPIFKPNPSISFFVVCETEAELDNAWEKLSEGGKVMMPLDKYPWSEKYGWVGDKYGVSWQLSLGKLEEVGQKFSPSLLFVGEQHGRAEEAMNLYTSIFKNSSIAGVMRHEEGGEEPAGTVAHAQFTVDGNVLMVMDSAQQHDFQFSEGVSLMVHCKTQEEVDYYWEKFTADGGQESQCGWLKDKFGVSWQITPDELLQLNSDPDPARAQRAMGAMMQMKKIDIQKIREAADDESKTVITVETVVDAPIKKVWQYWTQPEHITQWNSPSEDWHTPRAENDLRNGGAFNFRMEARDGSFGFDFNGIYDDVVENERLEYTLADDRKVQVHFSHALRGTHVMETFEAENMNPVEMQKDGWQAILDNFKKHVENN